MKPTPNERIVTLKIKRGRLCDLILACTSLSISTEADKWGVIRNELKAILADFDAKNDI